MNPRNDNPVGQDADRVFAYAGRKSFSEKMSQFLVGEGVPDMPTSELIDKLDPHRISPLFDRPNTIVARSRAQKEELFQQLRREYMGVGGLHGVLESFRTRGQAPSLIYNPTERALFLGFDTGATMPLPLQRQGFFRRGVVHFGRKTRGAYMAAMPNEFFPGGMREASFSELFYENLAQSVRQSKFVDPRTRLISRVTPSVSKDLLKRTLGTDLTEGALPGRKLALRTLLQEGASIPPGFDFSYFGTMRVLTGPEVTDLEEARKQITGALSDINVGFSQGNLEMFEEGRRGYRQALMRTASSMKQMGIADLFPFMKPEVLLDPSRPLAIPTSDTGSVYGLSTPASHAAKGRFFERRLGILGEDQIQQFMDLEGRPPVPFVTREGQMKAAMQEGQHVLTRNVPLRVGVVEFENEAMQHLFMGDSAAIMLRGGRQKFRTRQLRGEVVLAGYTQQTLKDIETVFGIKMGDLRQRQFPDVKLPIDAKEMRRIRRTKIGPLIGDRDEAMRRLMRSSVRGGTIWQSIAGKDTVLSQATFDGGKLKLSFTSGGSSMPISTAMVIGDRRATAITLGRDHALMPAVREAQRRGLDLLIPASEFGKGIGHNHLLNQFFAVMTQEGERELMSQIQGVKMMPYEFKAPAGSRAVIDMPVVTDEATAIRSVQDTLERLKTKAPQLYEKILQGEQVSTQGMGLSNIIRSIRVYNTTGGLRIDNFLDMSELRRSKMTPSKMRLLGLQSSLLGYSSPLEDPAFRAMHGLWEKATGYRLNAQTKDLVHPESIQRFLLGAVGYATPEPQDIIRSAGQQLHLGDRTFRGLPHPDSLRKPGAPIEAVTDTLFDPLWIKQHGDRTYYLDLGKFQDMSFLSRKTRKGVERIQRPIRYLPINMSLLGIALDSNKQLILGNTHIARKVFEFLYTFERMGPDILDPKKEVDVARRLGLHVGQLQDVRKQFLESVEESMQQTIRRMAGKPKGLLEKLARFKTTGARTRLTPQWDNLFGEKDLTDPKRVFDVYMGREQFFDTFKRKVRGFDAKHYRRLAEQGDLYALFVVDPAQRPEHLLPVRVHLTDAPSAVRGGRANLAAHPFLMSLVKRDHDKDVGTLVLLENALDEKRDTARFHREMAHRLDMQSKLVADEIHLWHREMIAKPGSINTTDMFFEKVESSMLRGMSTEQVADYLEQFLGQKATASFGYTLQRQTRGLAELITSPTSEQFRGIIVGRGGRNVENFTDDVISEIRGLFGSREAFESLQSQTSGLIQAVMQSGVGKGKAKDRLFTLMAQMVGVRQAVEAGAPVSQAIASSEQAFEQFFRSIPILEEGRLVGTAEREFHMVLPYLMRDTGLSREVILGDLERGRTEMMEHLIRSASHKMGRIFGASMFINAKAGAPLVDAMTPMESKGLQPWQTLKKVFQGVTGTSIRQVDDLQAPILRQAEEKVARETVKKAMDNVLLRRGLLIGGAAGLAGAFLGNQLFGGPMEAPLQAPLPPEPQVEPQRDAFRPPQFRKVARLSPEHAPPAGRTFSMRGVGPRPRSPSFGSAMYGSLVMRDETRSISPYAVEQQMKQIASSDYTY